MKICETNNVKDMHILSPFLIWTILRWYISNEILRNHWISNFWAMFVPIKQRLLIHVEHALDQFILLVPLHWNISPETMAKLFALRKIRFNCKETWVKKNLGANSLSIVKIYSFLNYFCCHVDNICLNMNIFWYT